MLKHLCHLMGEVYQAAVVLPVGLKAYCQLSYQQVLQGKANDAQ